MGSIWLKKCHYYHRQIDVVGKVQGVCVSEGQIFLDLEATGTEDEAFLRAISGKTGRRMTAHVCGPECGNALTDDFLVHGREYEPVEPGQKPWYTNLVQVGPQEGQEMDEMAVLRLEAEKRRGGEEGRPDVPPKEKKESEKKKDKKRKEVDDKERKKRKESSEESSELCAGQKELSALYAGTALDPAPKVRNRILKKARKMGRGRKKKKRRPSSSSKGGSTYSSSSSSGRFEHGGLFSSEKKMKVIWRRYPGALAASSLMDAREVLLTDSGTMWDADRKQMPPLATQFVRQHLAANMSAPMYQEALTLSSCIDNLLLGRPATIRATSFFNVSRRWRMSPKEATGRWADNSSWSDLTKRPSQMRWRV